MSEEQRLIQYCIMKVLIYYRHQRKCEQNTQNGLDGMASNSKSCRYSQHRCFWILWDSTFVLVNFESFPFIFREKKERKGRLKQILHLYLASQGFSFPSREDDQQPTKVTGGSSLFFLLPSFLSSRAENSFWQANCRKISYPDSVSLVILLKLKKSKVTEQ